MMLHRPTAVLAVLASVVLWCPLTLAQFSLPSPPDLADPADLDPTNPSSVLREGFEGARRSTERVGETLEREGRSGLDAAGRTMSSATPSLAEVAVTVRQSQELYERARALSRRYPIGTLPRLPPTRLTEENGSAYVTETYDAWKTYVWQLERAGVPGYLLRDVFGGRYETNQPEAMARVAGTGPCPRDWCVAWGREITERDAGDGLVAAGVSAVTGSPVFANWARGLVIQSIKTMQRELGRLGERIRPEVIEAVKALAMDSIQRGLQGRRPNVSAIQRFAKIEAKAGLVRYSGRNTFKLPGSERTTVSTTWGFIPFVAVRLAPPQSPSARPEVAPSSAPPGYVGPSAPVRQPEGPIVPPPAAPPRRRPATVPSDTYQPNPDMNTTPASEVGSRGPGTMQGRGGSSLVRCDGPCPDDCFIATAAYGASWSEEVRTLRRFRDRYLLPHAPGRWLVGLYYRHSPPLATAISESRQRRRLARVLLTPVVLFAAEPPLALAALLLPGAVWASRRRRAAHRHGAPARQDRRVGQGVDL